MYEGQHGFPPASSPVHGTTRFSSSEDINRFLDTSDPLAAPGTFFNVQNVHTSHLGAAASVNTSCVAASAGPNISAGARVLDVARMENYLRQLYGDKLRGTVQAVVHALSVDLPLDHVFAQLMQDPSTASFCKVRLGEVVETFLFSVQAHQYHTLASELARREMEVVQLVGQLEDAQQQLTPNQRQSEREIGKSKSEHSKRSVAEKSVSCHLLLPEERPPTPPPRSQHSPLSSSSTAIRVQPKAEVVNVSTMVDCAPLRNCASQANPTTFSAGTMTEAPPTVASRSCETEPMTPSVEQAQPACELVVPAPVTGHHWSQAEVEAMCAGVTTDAVQRLREASEAQLTRIEELLSRPVQSVAIVAEQTGAAAEQAPTQVADKPVSPTIVPEMLADVERALQQLTDQLQLSHLQRQDDENDNVGRSQRLDSALAAIHDVHDITSGICSTMSRIEQLQLTTHSDSSAGEITISAKLSELHDSVMFLHDGFVAREDQMELAASFRAARDTIASFVQTTLHNNQKSSDSHAKQLLTLLCVVVEAVLCLDPNREQLLGRVRQAIADAANSQADAAESLASLRTEVAVTRREVELARMHVTSLEARCAMLMDEHQSAVRITGDELNARDHVDDRARVLASVEQAVLGENIANAVEGAVSNALAAVVPPLALDYVSRIQDVVQRAVLTSVNAAESSIALSEAVYASAQDDASRAAAAEQQLAEVLSVLEPLCGDVEDAADAAHEVAQRLDIMCAARREATNTASMVRNVLIHERSEHRRQLRILHDAVRKLQLESAALRSEASQGFQEVADRFSLVHRRLLLEVDRRSAATADQVMDFLKAVMETLRPVIPAADAASPRMIERLLKTSDDCERSAVAGSENVGLEAWLRGMLAAIQSTVDSVTSERAERNAECSLVVTANGELQGDLWSSRQREAELEAEIASLKQTARDVHAALEQEVATLKAENNCADTKHAKDAVVLRSNLHSLDVANKQLVGTIEKLRTELHAANDQRNELQQDLDAAHNALDAAQQELDALRECRSNAETNLHQAVAKLAREAELSKVLAVERDQLAERLLLVTRQLRVEEARNGALHERCLTKEAEHARLSLSRARSDSLSRSVTDHSPPIRLPAPSMPSRAHQKMIDSSDESDGSDHVGLSVSPKPPQGSPITA